MEAEAEHIEREDEAPTAEAIQDAFREPEAAPMPEPAPEPMEAPPAEPQTMREPAAEAEHIEREDEGPTADAIQEAFDEPVAEPVAAESNQSAGDAAWPAEDTEDTEDTSGAGDVPTVGFGLFRGQPSSASAPSPTSETEAREEPLLWYGDEQEAAQLEVAAEGWRDQDHAPAGTHESHLESVSPTTTVSDTDLERIAADEGWDSSDVEAMRAYLHRNAGRVADEPPPDQPAEAAPEPPGPPSEPRDAQQDQDWLRGRRGTAAGAYRRLRRLFDN
jgi:hypothetical protein